MSEVLSDGKDETDYNEDTDSLPPLKTQGSMPLNEKKMNYPTEMCQAQSWQILWINITLR